MHSLKVILQKKLEECTFQKMQEKHGATPLVITVLLEELGII